MRTANAIVWIAILTVVALALSAADDRALAVCNVIPGVTNAFRGTLGVTDRPFAGPGDWVDLSLDGCGAASGFAEPASANVVTIVFTPPHGGPRHVVVLAAHCPALDSQIEACNQAEGVRPVCRPADGESLEVWKKADVPHLRFRFPDTDGLLNASNDNLTFTGPATVALTAEDAPLPCGLVHRSCADQVAAAPPIACVDALFAEDAGCGTAPHGVFNHFTALPPPNNYQALCTEPAPPCTGRDDEVRFTIDTDGNALVPMDWLGVLVSKDKVPIPRLIRTGIFVEAFAETQMPLSISDASVLGSYSPEGSKLPPLFDPQIDVEDPSKIILFGSADAARGVLRIARHRPLRCAGGANDSLACRGPQQCPEGSCTASCFDGSPCSSHADCSAGGCDPPLFDFSDRLVQDVGPVLIRRECLGGSLSGMPCAADTSCPDGKCRLDARASDPVPLDGLNQSADLNAFVVSEALVDDDLNGDGDPTDEVVELSDRRTGLSHTIGRPGVAGRAGVRIRQLPFSFPAVAVEGDVLAFLESEPGEGATDINGNGRVFESILRVFHRTRGELTPANRAVSADGAPVLNGRAVVVSGGSVFFRTAEAAAARQTTELVSSENHGAAISGNGRLVAYNSSSLVPVPGENYSIFVHDVFLLDRVTGLAEQMDLDDEGLPAASISNAYGPWISADGQVVGFGSTAPELMGVPANGRAGTFVRDRPARLTERVDVATDEAPSSGNDYGLDVAISANGRWIAFNSNDPLVPGDTNQISDIFVRDRLTGSTERVSVTSGGGQLIETGSGRGGSQGPAISADGRFVAFWSIADNVVPFPVPPPGWNVFVHDRLTGTTELVSKASDGAPGNAESLNPSLSADGHYVAFYSYANNLAPGDTNGLPDVFVHDRVTGVTERVSVASDGTEAAGASYDPRISADGRLVAFSSGASNLVADDTSTCAGGFPCRDVFLHDRVTGATTRVSVAYDGSQGVGAFVGYLDPDLSADGRFVVFDGDGFNMVPEGRKQPHNKYPTDIFVRGVDVGDLSPETDLSQDGDLADTVLMVLHTNGDDLQPRALGPADSASIAGGNVAFLRPESAGAPGSPDGVRLNFDDDTTDAVVQLSIGGQAAINLEVAATSVSLSDTHVAALVSEAGQGRTKLNDDDDTDDAVVEVRTLNGTAWTNTRQAADRVEMCGSVAVFITPDSAQGAILNDDGNRDDRVLQLFDPSTGTTINVGQAAEDFVCSPQLVAFRTREAAQGQNLNAGTGDTDMDDDVLQVYDLAPECLATAHPARCLTNTQQAVRPCDLEACDPRVPYRVGRDTVTFLTLECDQGGDNQKGCPQGGQDLNGDQDAGDLVLQVFNVRQAVETTTTLRSSAPSTGRGRRLRAGVNPPRSRSQALAAVSAGVCTDTAEACAMDSNCPAGKCFMPPGGCIRDLHRPCDPKKDTNTPCGAGEFCQPIAGSAGQGTCKKLVGPCASDATCDAVSDCNDAATPCVCNASARNLQRLVSPLVTPPGEGVVFSSAGRCLENTATRCSTEAPCPSPEFCGPKRRCQREHGSCRTTDDCPRGSICEKDLIIATASDRDKDEIADPFDNCPDFANPSQADSDGNGLGDECDGLNGFVCGNGKVEPGEECDDGNVVAGDGCDAACRAEKPGPRCPRTPALGCRRPAVSRKARLVLENKDRDTEDRLGWEWRRGAATAKSEFGNPLTTDSYALCIYDRSGLIAEAVAPAGGVCGEGAACWRAGSRGFRYRDKELTPDGLAFVRLTAGAEGKASIRVEGRGGHLPDTALATVLSPVTAQLINSRECWEAVYSAPFIKQEPGLLRDTAD